MSFPIDDAIRRSLSLSAPSLSAGSRPSDEVPQYPFTTRAQVASSRKKLFLI